MVTFGVPGLHFGGPGGPRGILWGPWGAIWEQGPIFNDFSWIWGALWDVLGCSRVLRGHLLGTFWCKIGLRTEDLGIQGLKIRDWDFFLIFGHPGTYPWPEKPWFRVRGAPIFMKSKDLEKASILMIFWCHFRALWCRFWDLRAIFWTLGGIFSDFGGSWRQAWNLMIFHGYPGGAQVEIIRSGVGYLVSPGSSRQ